jgi:hypothetical protein
LLLQVSYHGGSSYPGAHEGGGGGGLRAGKPQAAEARALLEEVVEEALRQVELRGWGKGGPAPPDGFLDDSAAFMVAADGSGRGGRAAAAAIAVASVMDGPAAAPAPAAGGRVMKTSSSLADVKGAVKRTYVRLASAAKAPPPQAAAAGEGEGGAEGGSAPVAPPPAAPPA